MTALAADIQVLSRDSALDIRTYKVADNVLIYKGGVVVIDASGYARPARNTAGELVVGVAEAKFDNTITGHAAGGRDALGKVGVQVKSGAHFLLLCSATASQASVGQPFFALDDQTIRATLGNGNQVGEVTEYVDATHVWVFIPPGGGVVSAQTLLAQVGQATAAGGGAAGIIMGTGLFGVYFGSGAPSISAAKGSLYLRSDGSSTSTRLYVNTDGATTWTNVTTAA